MVLVISRFRVANEMESQVRQAFRNRPRLVEQAAGFLGMDVFTDVKDPSLFYLVTRWTDEASFNAWHRSEAHRLSHQGIPPGLKLAPDFTEVRRLERLPASSEETHLERIADAVPLLARFLADSQSIHLVIVDADGRVSFCNRALLARLKLSESQVVGKPIGNLLTQPDAVGFRERAEQPQRSDGKKLLLNFVDAEQSPFTLECSVDVHPAYFLLVGELPQRKNAAAADELLRLNNELAVLGRESARKTKELERAHSELEKALADLQTSHWHLKKLQEVLPICLECGKVKPAGQWEDLYKYFKENALILSHGYCPECLEHMKAQFGLSPKE